MADKSRRPILIVDDEPEMLFSLKGLLHRDYEIFTAESGAEGLEVLRTHEPHIVMTDQRMPEMSGVEFLKQIKHEHPEAIRLIFTGFAETASVIDAINQGNVYRFVPKPWDPDQLLETLEVAGRRHDQIVIAKRLLIDMRAYKLRNIEFIENARSGKFGPISTEGMSEAERLTLEGRALLDRIGAALQTQEACQR